MKYTQGIKPILIFDWRFFGAQVFTDMPGGKQGDQEEVVITGDALIKRCPQQDQRRGDVVEPDYGGRMQVCIPRLHDDIITAC